MQTIVFQQDLSTLPPPSIVPINAPRLEKVTTLVMLLTTITHINTLDVIGDKLSDVLLAPKDCCTTRNGTHVCTKESSNNKDLLERDIK